MSNTLVARNATQALSWGPIAFQLSDEEGRVSDQQGWYHGKRLPSLDGAGVLIHLDAKKFFGLKNNQQA
jgi:hypothetical protein